MGMARGPTALPRRCNAPPCQRAIQVLQRVMESWLADLVHRNRLIFAIAKAKSAPWEHLQGARGGRWKAGRVSRHGALELLTCVVVWMCGQPTGPRLVRPSTPLQRSVVGMVYFI